MPIINTERGCELVTGGILTEPTSAIGLYLDVAACLSGVWPGVGLAGLTWWGGEECEFGCLAADWLVVDYEGEHAF